MKILFVVTAYPRDEDDVITPWLGETIDRLGRAGIQVEVFAPSYRGSRTHTVSGVRVHRFRYAPAVMESLTHDMPALDRIKKNPAFMALVPSYVGAGSRAAARVAREGSFDVVHAFWPIPHGLFAIAAKRASGAAMVSTFFSAELTWPPRTRRFFAPVLRKVIRASDAITVISGYTGQLLREYVPDVNSVTIPFGAAASVSAAAKETSAGVHTVVRKPADPFELLFVGRLVRRKGVDVLLRAIARLAHDTRLTLSIVGGGPEKGRLEALAMELSLSDRVRFEGVVSAEEIARRFRGCDALVLPAIVTDRGDTEGLGVVLIEAMEYGKPVIGSSAGGIVDIVKDGETGLLVPPGDAQALASAITYAMDHPSEMSILAEKGQRFAAETFGWDAIISRLSDVYESAVAARRGS